MQDSFANPPQWLQLALTAVVSLVAREGIVKFYNTWLNRKKPAAEIHRTHAESTEIFIRAGAAASDSVARMMDRLSQAQIQMDQLRQERDGWQREYDREFKLRKAQDERVDLQNIEVQSLRDQVDGAYAYVKFLGKHPTDVDRFRVQLKEEKMKSDTTDKKGQPRD